MRITSISFQYFTHTCLYPQYFYFRIFTTIFCGSNKTREYGCLLFALKSNSLTCDFGLLSFLNFLAFFCMRFYVHRAPGIKLGGRFKVNNHDLLPTCGKNSYFLFYHHWKSFTSVLILFVPNDNGINRRNLSLHITSEF